MDVVKISPGIIARTVFPILLRQFYYAGFMRHWAHLFFLPRAIKVFHADRQNPPAARPSALSACRYNHPLHSTPNRIRNLAGVIGKFISAVQHYNEHLEYLLLTEPLKECAITFAHFLLFLDLKTGFCNEFSSF
jgi:hypothetical protein